jgi:hypothetical protein
MRSCENRELCIFVAEKLSIGTKSHGYTHVQLFI